MLRALPLALWAVEVMGGISRHTSTPRVLLSRRITTWEHAANSRLIPGIIESMPGAMQKIHTGLGLDPMPITKNHQGWHHVCQPWEDCDGQEHEMEEEVINASKVKKAGTLDVKKDGALLKPPRTCPEWGATQLGCECLDSCECKVPSGPPGAKVHRCRTRMVKSEVDGSESPCGDPDATENWYDTCLVHTTPFPYPKLRTESPKGEPPADPKLWRNYNSYKNKRFLPKSACYSRDYYCANFPAFPGCDPQKTYSKLVRSHLTEEQQAIVDKCKSFTDQKKCEEDETCGKGKHSTCHPTCVYTEDAPMWFRRMRGDANMKIKKSGKDPARTNDGSRLPVLQPGPGTGKGEFGTRNLGPSDATEDTVIKSGDVTEKAGAHVTTPAPEQVVAGDVGTKRSEGWLDPSEVGKNIGSDNVAVGKFRPRGAFK